MCVVTVRAFFFQVIEDSIARDREERQFKEMACFSLHHNDPVRCPGERRECEAGDVTRPHYGIDKKINDCPVPPGESAFFYTGF